MTRTRIRSRPGARLHRGPAGPESLPRLADARGKSLIEPHGG